MSPIRFNPDGSCVFIYEDEHPLLTLGRPSTRRASHVEPTEDCRWQADMGPVGGPVLDEAETKKEALHLEVRWLERRLSQ